MADSGFVFTLDGKRHELNFEEITGRNAKEFRDQTGVPFRRAITMFSQHPDDVDIDSLAGLAWLARRQAGEQVTFDTVLGEITYSTAFEVEASEVDSPEV